MCLFGFKISPVAVKTLDVGKYAFPVGSVLHHEHVVHFEKWHRAQYLVSHAEGDLMSVGESEEAIESRHFVLACVLILVDDSSPHRDLGRRKEKADKNLDVLHCTPLRSPNMVL